MAVIKCKKCGKNFSDKKKACPKCGWSKESATKKNKWLDIANILLVLLTIVLSYVLIRYSKNWLYSEKLSDLWIIISLCLILMIASGIIIKITLNNNLKKVLKVFSETIGCIGLLIFAFYFIGSLNALYYKNSQELVILSEKFKYKEAKAIKEEIERIFEYDEKNIYSRDVLISNFYYNDTQNIYSLYLDDSHGNYSLKFSVEILNNKFKNVYYEKDDYKFYLVKDGKKTDDFEYYYAMYILDNVLGEDISGISKIEDDIEKNVEEQLKLENTANYFYTYEELEYNKDKNIFTVNCSVEDMNYYGNLNNHKFLLTLKRNDNYKNKKNWYYGDSSFDYVNFIIEIYE